MKNLTKVIAGLCLVVSVSGATDWSGLCVTTIQKAAALTAKASTQSTHTAALREWIRAEAFCTESNMRFEDLQNMRQNAYNHFRAGGKM